MWVNLSRLTQEQWTRTILRSKDTLLERPISAQAIKMRSITTRKFNSLIDKALNLSAKYSKGKKKRFFNFGRVEMSLTQFDLHKLEFTFFDSLLKCLRYFVPFVHFPFSVEGSSCVGRFARLVALHDRFFQLMFAAISALHLHIINRHNVI